MKRFSSKPATLFQKNLIIVLTSLACLLTVLFVIEGINNYRAWKTYFQGVDLVKNEGRIEEGLALTREAAARLLRIQHFLEVYGAFLEGINRDQEAIAVYETALERFYFPSFLERLAELNLEKGNFRKTIKYAEEELKIIPWKLTPRYLLASAYLATGHPDKSFSFALDTILTPMKVPSSKGMELKKLAREILPQAVAKGFAAEEIPSDLLPGEMDPLTASKLKTAFAAAGNNREELLKALAEIPTEQEEALIFLLVNMPERDLQSLDSEYLLKNVDLAFQVRNLWPFLPDIPDNIFLNYLLPYALTGEERDDWREDFLQRFLPVVKDCKSVGEIVLSLHVWIPNAMQISYDHENISRPLQSIGTTVELKRGDCVGLSILLAGACRSIGVPARITAIPSWKGVPGGHAWVEIYDQGEWRHVAAFDLSPLDQTWFEERTAATDTSQFQHRIYGASFRRTGIQILNYGPDAWWADITDNYVEQ